MAKDDVANALRDVLISTDVSDSNLEPANLVDVVDRIAYAIKRGLSDLGTGNACTPMGAIEFHASQLKDAGDTISSSLGEVASALQEIAEAIRDLKGK